MTRPCSNDHRKRVVQAHLAGETKCLVAARFGVGVSSVLEWVALWCETGSRTRLAASEVGYWNLIGT